MRDHTEADATVAGNTGAALEIDDNGVAVARAEALGNADYASLTRRAATDNSRALVDEVLRLITLTEAETHKRQRSVSRADAFRQAVEGFVGDLLAATGREGN